MLDTLIITALCLQTDSTVSGYLLISPDTVQIQTTRYAEKSAVRWIDSSTGELESGTHLTLKPLGGFEVWHRERKIFIIGQFARKNEEYETKMD